MKYILLISLALTAVLSLTPFCTNSAAEARTRNLFTERSQQEESVKEAVFRYLFEHNASALQQKAHVYFLSFNKDTDPSDTFMTRFRGNKPPVKKVSKSLVGGKGAAVEDRASGKRGLIFRIDSIKWLNETEVDVEGGYYEANMSSSWSTLRVVLESDKWVVKKDLGGWISARRRSHAPGPPLASALTLIEVEDNES